MFIAYTCAKRWLIELLSSLLQMRLLHSGAVVSRALLIILKCPFYRRSRVMSIDQETRRGKNDPSDRCAYGQWIKEEGKLAFSGFIFSPTKCLKKINVAT